jgi:hypothetical protein
MVGLAAERAHSVPAPGAGLGGRGLLRGGVELIRRHALLFGALVLWSFGPLVAVLVHVLVNGGVMTGVNGGDYFDQFQYLAWIRDEGAHGLASNLWVIGPTAHDYLQPMYFISAVLWRIGLSLQLAYLIWKPVGLLVLFLGCAWYVTHLEPEHRGRQAAAIALAIFYQSPAYALGSWTGQLDFSHQIALLLATDDATPAVQMWGFEHTAIAIGATAAFFVCAERLLHGSVPRRWTIGACVAGAWLAWLHPWQAAIVLAVLAAMFVLRAPRRRFLALALPVAAVVMPLLYGLALSHYDIWWHTFKVDSTITGTAPWWALIASLGPLALFAALGLRRPESDREWILLLWVPATIAVYFLIPEFPPHALAGITVPLGVLAVRGWRRAGAWLRVGARPASAAAILAIGVATIPAAYYHARNVSGDLARTSAGRISLTQLRLTTDEAAAMTYLDHAGTPGGVFAPPLLSVSVPAFTGREVFVGHLQWEPPVNSVQANMFYAQASSGALRRDILRRSGARFLLAPCGSPAGLAGQLAPVARPVWRRGCVTVYQATGAIATPRPVPPE